MLSGSILTALTLTLGALPITSASVTVYYQQNQQQHLGTATGTGSAASYTGAAAYNPTILKAPAPPNPAINTQFGIQLQNGGTQGVSIPQSGSFFGFSIEMSVVNQVLGKNASFIQVPFLNLMANLQQRAGVVHIRVGGNTQETAVLVDSTPDGRILEKDQSGVTNPTQTPPLIFTPELLYMMANVSSLVNARWFLGIPFNDTSNFRLAIAEAGQRILGDHLIGLQAANEPDLYAQHNHRPTSYGPPDYLNELKSLVAAMAQDTNIPNRNLLIAPNIAANWSPESVWQTGLVDQLSEQLAFLAVERYPEDNCYAAYGVGNPTDPQATFPIYLNHTGSTALVSYYIASTDYAQSKGKPMLMFETNTASCGGFPGISDSFGAALWGLDYALQMAAANFSGAMFHVGGQNVYYNPFTPPPTNQSTFRQWTVGPIYYSAIVMAETIGASNKSQVLDLNANAKNIYTPAYGIYENGNPVRVVLFNYITDSSHANDITVSISIGGGQTGQGNATPGQVKVKYLAASSVSQKGNFTWAGQTFGSNFGSDGRLQGDEDIKTITCDTNANSCAIPVPAPGVALVFLDGQVTETSGAQPTTFPTTARTKTVDTVTVDPSVLATSNGHAAVKDKLGSTSKGSVSGTSSPSGMSPVVWGQVAVVASLVLGVVLLL